MKNTINTQELLKKYISTLKEMGKFVPAWIYDVEFVEEDVIVNGYAYASAENNKIYYKSDATEHALVHELDHLRSRHETFVTGYDEDFERFVEFYFVGFRLGGFTGAFIEEGFNELSSRNIYLRMLKNEPEKRRAVFLEYNDRQYYNFEMFTSIAICSLLGLKVEELSSLKFSGNTSGQEAIKLITTYLTNDANYWSEMQSNLDSYIMAKRMCVSKDEKERWQKENMQNYYNSAYMLLFKALEYDKISKEEFKTRLRLFEFYTRRATKNHPEIIPLVYNGKEKAVQRFKKVLSKNLLIVQQSATKEEQRSFLNEFIDITMEEVYPAVTKSFPDMLKDVLFKKTTQNLSKTLSSEEEIDYGLS